MKLLELFSGTKSMAKVFKAAGWQVLTIDNNPELKPDLCMDIMNVTPELIYKYLGQPDIIWASPPCTTFSVASIGTHWTGGKGAYIPKTTDAIQGLKLASHAIKLIRELSPLVYYIENPRGMLRKMPIMDRLTRYTVTYCQYGDSRMKPTDIWTNHHNPQFKPMCKNGDSCHEAAPRGSRTGTQGLKGAKERGVIPVELCKHILRISEEYMAEINDFEGGTGRDRNSI